MKADQIIVLDYGRIVGKGTHSELMASCETYREIALSQFSKEELAWAIKAEGHYHSAHLLVAWGEDLVG